MKGTSSLSLAVCIVVRGQVRTTVYMDVDGFPNAIEEFSVC